MTRARSSKTSRFGTRKARWAVGVVAAIVSATLVPTLAGASHPLASLSDSKFEIDVDANLKVDHASPSIDWATVADIKKDDAPTGRNDNSFSGGAKEDDPCPGTTTGSIPNNKSDLLTFGVYEEPGDPGFLHMFWTRVLEPSGTTLMDFELNQSSTDCGNGVNPVRTPGDLLIEYRIEQGGATAQILVREWTGSAWGPEQNLTGSLATGTINNSAIPSGDSDGLVTTGTISPRTFGEASLDLDFIFDENECRSFGSAFLKSRSSTSFTSQLKDFIAPIPVQLSNCGTIIVNKQTDPDGAAGSFGFTTTGGLSPATFSLSDNGTRTYSNVLAGTYSVTESSGGGDLTSIVCTGGQTTVTIGSKKVDITLAADETVTCTFNNALKGSILVHKVDGANALLGGAGFTITPGGIIMASPSTGVFCTDNLSFGSYTVTETTVPNGYSGSGPQNFSVSSTRTCAEKIAAGDSPDLTFTNSPAPGRINIAKTDDDGAPLNNVVFTLYRDDGDAVFEGGTDDASVGTCTTGVSNSNGTTPAAGACSFIDVALGSYWVDETGAPAGYSEATGLPMAVTVGLGASPGTGQTINLPGPNTAFVNPQTHKVIVIVCHEGKAELAASDVTNGDGSAPLTTIGDAPAFATEAQLCSLNGFTGKAHGNKSLTVDVGSDGH